MKTKLLIFLLLMVMAIAPAPRSTTAQTEDPSSECIQGGVDVVMLLDMGILTNISENQVAMHLSAEVLGEYLSGRAEVLTDEEDFNFSVLRFSDEIDVDVLLPMQPLPLAAESGNGGRYSALSNAVGLAQNPVVDGRYIDLVTGFQAAAAQLQSTNTASDPDRSRIIILLSDHSLEIGANPADFQNRIAGSITSTVNGVGNTSLFYFGTWERTDLNTSWQSRVISNITAGGYFDPQVSYDAMPKAVLDQVRSQLCPIGEAVSAASFEIPAYQSQMSLFFYPESASANATLVSPTGDSIIADFFDGELLNILNVAEPMPGRWQLLVENTNVDVTNQDFFELYIRPAESSTAILRDGEPLISGVPAYVGEDLTITWQPEYRSGEVINYRNNQYGLTVVATITSEERTIQQGVMDVGSDGVFTLPFESPTAGDYHVEFLATLASGQVISTDDTIDFSLEDVSLQFSGDYTPEQFTVWTFDVQPIADVSGNRLTNFDDLDVTATIRVNDTIVESETLSFTNGSYQSSDIFVIYDEFELEISATMETNAGNRSLDVMFPDAPSTGESNKTNIDVASVVGNASFSNATPRMLEEINIFYTPPDNVSIEMLESNGIFIYARISTIATTENNTSYTWLVRLNPSEGRYEGRFYATSTQEHELEIVGRVSRSGVEEDVFVFPTPNKLVASIVGVQYTGRFNYNQFDAWEPVFTLSDGSNLVNSFSGTGIQVTPIEVQLMRDEDIVNTLEFSTTANGNYSLTYELVSSGTFEVIPVVTVTTPNAASKTAPDRVPLPLIGGIPAVITVDAIETDIIALTTTIGETDNVNVSALQPINFEVNLPIFGTEKLYNEYRGQATLFITYLGPNNIGDTAPALEATENPSAEGTAEATDSTDSTSTDNSTPQPVEQQTFSVRMNYEGGRYVAVAPFYPTKPGNYVASVELRGDDSGQTSVILRPEDSDQNRFTVRPIYVALEPPSEDTVLRDESTTLVVTVLEDDGGETTRLVTPFDPDGAVPTINVEVQLTAEGDTQPVALPSLPPDAIEYHSETNSFTILLDDTDIVGTYHVTISASAADPQGDLQNIPVIPDRETVTFNVSSPRLLQVAADADSQNTHNLTYKPVPAKFRVRFLEDGLEMDITPDKILRGDPSDWFNFILVNGDNEVELTENQISFLEIEDGWLIFTINGIDGSSEYGIRATVRNDAEINKPYQIQNPQSNTAAFSYSYPYRQSIIYAILLLLLAIAIWLWIRWSNRRYAPTAGYVQITDYLGNPIWEVELGRLKRNTEIFYGPATFSAALIDSITISSDKKLKPNNRVSVTIYRNMQTQAAFEGILPGDSGETSLPVNGIPQCFVNYSQTRKMDNLEEDSAS